MTRLLAYTAVLFACATAAPLAVTHAQTAPASSTTAQAAAKLPNLSGTWELNVAASKFGPQGSPTKGTLTLTQAGDKITATQVLSTSTGDMTNTTHHTIGATTADTIRAQGQEVARTSTARWDGSTLVVDAKLMSQGMEIPVVARYTLSPDGKQLMVDQTLTSPMGELTTHLVFDKKS